MRKHNFVIFMMTIVLFGFLEIVCERPAEANNKFPLKLNELCPIEKWIISKVKDGKVADLKNFHKKGKAQKLNASFVEALITDNIKGVKVHYHGICIENAIITKPVNVEFAEIPYRVSFKNCIFEDEVILRNSYFKKSLEFNGSVFIKNVDFQGLKIEMDLDAELCRFLEKDKVLNFNGLKVGSSASFKNAIFYAPVDFVGMNIDRQFFVDEAVFLNNKTALFSGIVVGREAFFHETKFYGPVDFVGANIKGQFVANNAMFLNEDEGACFSGMKVGKEAFFIKAIFLGPVNFVGTNIDGQFILNNAYFLKTQTSNNKLNDIKINNFNRIKVGKATFFMDTIFKNDVSISKAILSDIHFGKNRNSADRDKKANKSEYLPMPKINLSYTVMQHGLRINDVEIDSFEAINLTVQEEAIFSNIKIRSLGDFRLGKYHNITFNDINLIPNREQKIDSICDEKRILMDGMSYDSIGDDKMTKCSEDEKCKIFLNICNIAEFNLANYKQLEDYFARCGIDNLCNEVYITGKRRELSKRERYDPIRWIIFIFWHKLVGHGRYPEYAFLWSLGVIVFGALFFFKPEIVEKNDQNDWQWLSTKTYFKRVFFRFFLSLDYFIPAVDLGLANKIPISRVSYVTLIYLHFHKAMGWLLIIIGLAAITSKIK